METVHWEPSCFMQADTGMTKLIVTFYNQANVRKNEEQPETISSYLCSCNLSSDSDRHFPASSLEALELLSESVTQVSWH